MSSNRPFFDLEAQRREAMRAQRATPGPLGFRKVRGSSDRNIRGLTMEKGRVNLRMFTADMEICGLRNSRISAFYDQPTGVDRAGPRPRHWSAPFRALTRVRLLSPEAHFDLSGSSAFPENRSFPGRLFQSRILRKNLRCKENHRFLFSSSILRSLSSRSISPNGAVRFPSWAGRQRAKLLGFRTPRKLSFHNAAFGSMRLRAGRAGGSPGTTGEGGTGPRRTSTRRRHPNSNRRPTSGQRSDAHVHGGGGRSRARSARTQRAGARSSTGTAHSRAQRMNGRGGNGSTSSNRRSRGRRVSGRPTGTDKSPDGRGRGETRSNRPQRRAVGQRRRAAGGPSITLLSTTFKVDDSVWGFTQPTGRHRTFMGWSQHSVVFVFKNSAHRFLVFSTTGETP